MGVLLTYHLADSSHLCNMRASDPSKGVQDLNIGSIIGSGVGGAISGGRSRMVGGGRAAVIGIAPSNAAISTASGAIGTEIGCLP